MCTFRAIETPVEASMNLAPHLKEIFKVKGTDKQMIRLTTARHTVTFREIRLEPFLIRVNRLTKIAGARTPFLGRFGKLPLSSATRKIAGSAIAHSRNPARIGIQRSS